MSAVEQWKEVPTTDIRGVPNGTILLRGDVGDRPGHMPPHNRDEWLRFVDEDIRALIRDLNELPFVECTVHSCAGCGRAGDFRRNPTDHPKGDPAGHFKGKAGYVTVAYRRESDWQEFHDTFVAAFDWFLPPEDPDAKFAEFGYYFDGCQDDDAMRAKWARAHAVVRAAVGT